jgi:hypothetical protein
MHGKQFGKAEEPSLPIREENLKGLKPSDAVWATWTDGFHAQISEKTVRKLRKIIETARKQGGTVYEPLWVGEVKRNHNKLSVELLVYRDLLMIISEQDRQVCQTRVDRWCDSHGELPEKQPCRAPDDHPAVQACLKFTMPLVEGYADDEHKGKDELQAARNAKLQSDNIP